MDSLGLVFKELPEEERIKMWKSIVNNWVRLCREEFGSENITFDEAAFFTKETSVTSIGNVPVEAVYYQSPDYNDGNIDVFMNPKTFPGLISTEELMIEWGSSADEFFFESFRNRSQSPDDFYNSVKELIEAPKFYPVEEFSVRFKKEWKLLSTTKLDKAAEAYLDAIKSENYAFDFGRPFFLCAAKS